MSADTCAEVTPGCPGCAQTIDEMTGLTNTTAREYEAWCNGHGYGYECGAEDGAVTGYEAGFDKGYLAGTKERAAEVMSQ